MTSVLTSVLIMQSIVLLSLLCGLCTFALAQFPGGSGFDGKEITNMVDPFLEERCQQKGVSYKQAQSEALSCVTRSMSGGSITPDMSMVCDIQDAKIACTRQFINKLKRCYDEESKKKELEMALKSQKATMDYMCEDNGRRFKDLMQDGDALKCMAMMGNQDKLNDMLSCVTEQTKNVDKMTSDVKTMCKVTIKTSNCMLHMFDDCESSKPQDFFFGSIEAGLRASPCEPYVDAYLGSAASNSLHFGLLAFVAILYVYFF